MKKLFLLLMICSNIIVFTLIVAVHEEKSITDTMLLYGYKEDKVSSSLLFNEDFYNTDLNIFNNKIEEVCKQYNVLVEVYNINEERNQYYYDICYDGELDTIFDIATTQSLVFDGSNTNYYQSGENLYLLNKSIDVEIKPFNLLVQHPGLITVYGYSNEEVNSAIESIGVDYQDYINEQIEYVQDAPSIQNNIQERLFLPLLICLFLTSIVLLTFISKNTKKIAVMRLHGYHSFSIFKEIFMIPILIIIICPIMTIGIISCFYIDQINSVTISLLIDLMKWTIKESIFYLSILSLYLIVISLTSNAILLKGNRHMRVFMTTSTIIKIICIIALYPLLLGAIGDYSLSSLALHKIDDINQIDNNYHYIETLKPQYRNNGYDLSRYYDDYFQNPNKDFTNEPILKEYLEGYNLLNEKGAIYFKESSYYEISPNGEQQIQIPVYEVNYNYTTLQSILDKDNQEVNFNKNSDDVYILTSNADLDIDALALPTTVLDVEIIVCKNLENLPIFSYIYFNESDPIFIVTMDLVQPIERSPIIDVYYHDDITDQAGEYFTGKIDVATLENQLNTYQHTYENMLKNSLFIFLVASCVVIITIIQYAQQYFKVNRQKITVKKMHGYRFIDIYYDLFIEEVLIYALLAAILVYLDFMIFPAILLALFDLGVLLCTALMIHKKSMVENLNKGDLT